MSRTTLAWALALSTAIAAPALAQNNTPTDNSAGAMKAAPATTAAPAAADSGKILTQAQTGDYRSTKLIGVDIYNNSGENVGEVNDLILDNSGSVKAVIIGVGGFLGIGEKNVAVPFGEIKWTYEPLRAATNANPPATANPPANSMATNNGVAPANPPVDTTGTVADNTKKDYPDHGLINMSKDQLKNAPEFKFVSDQK
jgi:sporulation protein YlmC with PRC-barrel domain